MISFDPKAWFWVVGGDETRTWSSAACAYVDQWDAERVTRIASETELTDVLNMYGLKGPHVTRQDYADAVQAHVDAAAQARGYLDGGTCASYAASTVPAWAADALTFIEWRDAVWVYVLAQLSAYQAGQIKPPTVSDLIVALPAVAWPT